jgi:S1-C subfamily serine protease
MSTCEQVPPGTPAAAAGLQPSYRDSSGAVVLGDIIVGFDSAPVKTTNDLLNALDKHRVGDKVTLDLLRQGRKVTANVTLGERRRGQGSE